MTKGVVTDHELVSIVIDSATKVDLVSDSISILSESRTFKG